MDFQSQMSKLTLIYHDFRGMAQLIRYVLFYLNIPFQEILLNQGQNPMDLEIVKARKSTDMLELPCLVHNDKFIQNLFAMLRYLSGLARRQDLLGQNLQERSVVREIFYNFLSAKKKQMGLFFSFVEKAAQNPGKAEQLRKITMQRSHQISESVVPLAKLKLIDLSKKYIFGHITLLDFLLFEQSFYQVNLFGNLELKGCVLFQAIDSIFKTQFTCKVKQKSSIYLRVIRQFKESFEEEQFYVKNKQQLESYSFLCPNLKPDTRQAFKAVWLGPEHFLK